MPGPTGGGRSGGGGGIGGGASHGGGFSGGFHGGGFHGGFHGNRGGFYHMHHNGNDPEQEKKAASFGRVILIIVLLLMFGSPFFSLVGNISTFNVWEEVDSVFVDDVYWETEPLFEIGTTPRAKLDESLCTPVDVWYFDMAELFEPNGEGELVEHALSYFYEQTGVQPLLVTTRYIDGTNAPSWDMVENYLYNLYIELFGDDEGHYIFLYFQHSDDSYTLYYIPGLDAMTVVDDEASSILMDYVEWYYYESSTYGEMFASAFADAADTIMYVPAEYTSAAEATEYVEASTYPPASTEPAVQADSSVELTTPVVELISEPDNAVAEDTSDEVEITYTEEITSEILWDEDSSEAPEEDFISDEALGGIFVIALAVAAVVVYVLWDKKKMRALEEDM